MTIRIRRLEDDVVDVAVVVGVDVSMGEGCSSDKSSRGTCTNNVQSRNVIFVASDDCGEVCARNKVGSNSDVCKCCAI